MPSVKSLEEFVSGELKKLSKNGLLRTIKDTDYIDAVHVERGGKELISFCSNDYLGLAKDKRVSDAAISGALEGGSGSGASRLVTGNYSLYYKLEEKLAQMKGEEASCVFGSGYLANIGVISSLVGEGDLIVLDRLVHSSIYTGAKLSSAAIKVYSHNDLSSLDKILKQKRNNYKKCLIITESVFSMDGDIAPLEVLRKKAEEHGSWLMADDAHGFGVVENDGKAHIQLGTLSKAVGCYGGYVCASQNVMNYIKTTARSLIYTTSLPPSVVNSAIAALEIIASDAALCKKPLQNAQYFTQKLELSLAQSAIVPLLIGGEVESVKAADELELEGFLVSAIRPPTVPKGTSRLRLTFSAMHKQEDIDKLVEIIKSKEWFRA